MSNLLILFGPQAVGKMTVGQEITKLTNYKLFHNHISIELSLKFYEYGTPAFTMLNDGIRNLFFDTAIKYNQNIIFTCILCLEDPNEYSTLKIFTDKFTELGGKVFMAELYADIETRKERNITENRLNEKPSKRNIEWSTEHLINSMTKHRMNTYENEYLGYQNFIKIDNTNLSAKETAKIIIEKFNLDK